LTPLIGHAIDETDSTSGLGWTMQQLDMRVRVEKDDPGFTVEGTIALRLDRDFSYGPTLWINRTSPAMQWTSVDGTEIASVDINVTTEQSSPGLKANIRLHQPAVRDDEITLQFSLETVGEAWQLYTRKEIALTSWIDAWYPVVEASYFTANLISIPGTTTLDLPGDWIAISDGQLLSRDEQNGRTIEVWDMADRPVARSFAAGAFHAAEYNVNGRMIRIYLIEEYEFGADALAQLVAASLEAQEVCLGPFPFAGYGVVEVPGNSGIDWGAASQQTFIMALSTFFEHEHGNLPLWAHEMCHGWWGNTVGCTGPGFRMAGEALAQFGVLIALDALEDRQATIEFMQFGRDGYIDAQNAIGYLKMVKEGIDHPLATLEDSDLSGGDKHNLVDSKGMWVYHMLRQVVGEDVFCATMRELIDQYTGRPMSLDDIREAFIAAAPEKDLKAFFAQWLDRSGVPKIESDWTMISDDSVRIVIKQTNKDEPFTLDLELDLVLNDGTTNREVVSISERETTIVKGVTAAVTNITVDPERDYLIWHPEYVVLPSTVDVFEMFLLGILATLVMDLLGFVFAKTRIVHPLITPAIVGRWVLYLLRGKFIHKDINETPALKFERPAALLFHYLIGILLSGNYLALELEYPIIYQELWAPVLFGIATTVLPWFLLYPSIGLGLLASKAPKRSPYIVTSLVNHTSFGLGLLIWITFFRRFLE
jgi:hypothetical protein